MTDYKSDIAVNRLVIGLLPAAGEAKRIAPLPCSKELYPIGLRSVVDEHDVRPKVVCHYLLEKMRVAGITKAYIVLRDGKWDIPAYLRDGSMLGMHIAYLMMGMPFGVPYTLDQAYPFLQDAVVAFGFPDILFQLDDTFAQLLARQGTDGADIVLGLFKADQPHKLDMVNLDHNGRVRELVIKPSRTQLRDTWGVAVWTRVFTEFMHAYLASHDSSSSVQPELSMGHVIEAAIRSGLKVDGLVLSEEPYIDIGTPEGLAKALKRCTA